MPAVPVSSSSKLTTPAGRALVVAARAVVAGVFVYAGVPKLLEPAAFAQSISNYHLVPESLVGPIAAVVPVLEIVVALALVTGFAARGAAIAAAAMLAVFSAAIAQAIARDIDIACGCFGTASSPEADWWSVARNVALLAAAVFVAVAPDAPWRAFFPRGAGGASAGRSD